MIIIVCVQLTVGGLAAFFKESTRNETNKFLRTTITRYYVGDNQPDAVNAVWNQLMTDMQCCGVNNYRDFEAAPKWNATRGSDVVPQPCCKQQTQPDGKSVLLDTHCLGQPSEANSFYMTVSL